MRKILFASLALFVASSASAKEADALEPAGPWAIDYGETQCVLYRDFGEGDDRIFLQFAQYNPRGSPLIKVAGKNLRPHPNTQVEFRVWIEPEESPTTIEHPLYAQFPNGLNGIVFIRGLSSSADNKKFALETRGKSPVEIEAMSTLSNEKRDQREAEITHLTIDSGLNKKVRLHIGGMKKPMEAMRTCLDTLVAKWGLDPSVQNSLSKRPIPMDEPHKWVNFTEYPTDLLRAGFQGLVDFRLMVDETGSVTDCIIQETSKPDDFAKITCGLMLKNAKFEPALDSNGAPTKSFWASRIHWVIPR